MDTLPIMYKQLEMNYKQAITLTSALLEHYSKKYAYTDKDFEILIIGAAIAHEAAYGIDATQDVALDIVMEINKRRKPGTKAEGIIR